MKLITKLYIGFLSLALVIGASSAIILMNDLEAEENLNSLAHINIIEITASSDVSYLIQRIKSNMREVLLETQDGPPDEEVEYAIGVIKNSVVVLGETGRTWIEAVKSDAIAPHPDSESTRSEMDELAELVLIMGKSDEFAAITLTFLDKVELGYQHWSEYAEYFKNEVEPFSRELQDLIKEAREETLAEASEEGLLLKQLLEANTNIAVITMVIASLMAIILSGVFARLIVKPLSDLLAAAKQAEQGDLDYRIPVKGHDEISTLGAAFNNMAAQIKERIEESESLAKTDYLTGMNNRRSFIHLGKVNEDMARRYGHSYSVMMIDIDYFKSINDTYGHAIGDEVIRELARVIMETTRPSDICGRIGGEEFAIILPESNSQGASDMAERLRTDIANIFIPSTGEPLPFTVSIGITELVNTDSSLEQLLAEADRALYQAKEQGRNRVCESLSGHKELARNS